jgi:hypothetical protein
MTILLHQNMQKYSGAAGKGDERTDSFFSAFNVVRQSVPTDTIFSDGPAVVGLTEITSRQNGPGLIRVLSGLNVTLVRNIACGFPALAARDEYVAIGVDERRFTVERSGRLFEEAADYRQVVYVVVTQKRPKKSFVVGFLHNMYKEKDNMAMTAQRIPGFLDELKKKAPGCDAYLGGDFNVGPLRREQYEPLSAVPREYKHRIERTGGTTWFGRFYDYWYWAAHADARVPEPRAFSDTLDGGPDHHQKMSDHCAITLRIHLY